MHARSNQSKGGRVRTLVPSPRLPERAFSPSTGRTTYYRGTKMRSRLEARAAAILDTIRVDWAYEPACFADGPVQYLPDFHLWPQHHNSAWFIDVKPKSLLANFDQCSADLDRMRAIRATLPDATLGIWFPELDKLLLHRPHWDAEAALDAAEFFDGVATVIHNQAVIAAQIWAGPDHLDWQSIEDCAAYLGECGSLAIDDHRLTPAEREAELIANATLIRQAAEARRAAGAA